MTTTLADSKVAAALDRMYTEAKEQMSSLGGARFENFENMTVRERSDVMGDFYLPVTPDSGRLLYVLARSSRPATIVEFGMSLGISAIHLAAAVRDSGSGRVITTELNADKVATAKKTFAEVGLDDLITVLEGDATETLKTLDGPVDFLLLDGWKDLYIPVLEILEPRLSPGSLVVADNTSMPGLVPYLDHMRDPKNGYVSVSFPARDSDSMEISCRG